MAKVVMMKWQIVKSVRKLVPPPKKKTKKKKQKKNNNKTKQTVAQSSISK